jgi:hypothetical protein
VLVGIVGAVADVGDKALEGFAGPVEGAPREAFSGGGLDDGGRLDGGAGGGEVLDEPSGAALELGGLGCRAGQHFAEVDVAEGGDGVPFALEDQAEGRGEAAKVGFEDF